MRPTNLWSGLTARATAQEASPLLTVPLPSTQTLAGSDHQPRAVLTVLPNFSGEAGMGYSTCTVVITGVKRLDLKAPSYNVPHLWVYHFVTAWELLSRGLNH